MPDGDKVHHNLHGYYQKPFKMLCADNFEPGETSHVLLKAIAHDIEKNYNVPVRLLNNAVNDLSQHVPQSPTDWCFTSSVLEAMIRSSGEKRLVKNLATDALRSSINQARSGYDDPITICTVVNSYLNRFYATRFEGMAPCNPQSYNNLSPDAICRRLTQIAPMVHAGLASMAYQVYTQYTGQPHAPRLHFELTRVTADTDLTGL